MIFSLLVESAPAGRSSSHAAYRFACALLEGRHELYRVFFFGDGAPHATRFAIPQGGEPDLPRLWQELAHAHGIDLVSCIGSALRRGVVDAREAARLGIEGASLREGYELSGLGQLVEAAIRSDRLLSFGG